MLFIAREPSKVVLAVQSTIRTVPFQEVSVLVFPIQSPSSVERNNVLQLHWLIWSYLWILSELQSKRTETQQIMKRKATGTEPKTIVDSSESDLCKPHYTQELNSPESMIIEHNFVGKQYFREWIDHTGQLRNVIGQIQQCHVDLESNEYSFTVVFDKDEAKKLRVGGVRNDLVECVQFVSEEEVTFGHERFLQECDPTRCINGCRRYIVPRNRALKSPNKDGARPLEFRFRGCSVTLEAKPSSIPGGGLGLWITFELCEERSNSVVKLEAGELVDLGVYAPLRVEDIQPYHLASLKNFLFQYSCEKWFFDPEVGSALAMLDSGAKYDLTSNSTGRLHDDALRQSISFANETDGLENSSIVALSDPEGAIHYYLGSETESLEFVTNTWIELKVDYGPDYEKCRVREGYSRYEADSKEYIDLVTAAQEDDCELLKDMRIWTLNELADSADFMDVIASSLNSLDELPPLAWELLKRCIVAVTGFRVNSALDSTVANRMKHLSCNFIATFKGQLKSRLCSDGFCNEALSLLFELPSGLDSLPSSALRQLLRECRK